MPLFLPAMTAFSVGFGSTTLVLSSALLLLLLPLAIKPTPLAFGRRCVHYSSTLIVQSCSLSAPQTSCNPLGRPTSCLSSEICRPSSARVSARSLMGSPRCDFTLIRKIALPARTRCISRQTISWRMSASGAVASVALRPCPTHFLIAHKTAALSHSVIDSLPRLVRHRYLVSERIFFTHPCLSCRTAHASAQTASTLEHVCPGSDPRSVVSARTNKRSSSSSSSSSS